MNTQAETLQTVAAIAGAVVSTTPLFKHFCCAICEDTGLVATEHQNEAGEYLNGRCWNSCEAGNSVVWSSEQEQWVKPSDQVRFTLRKNEGSSKKPWLVEDTHADPAQDPVIYHFASRLKAERFKSDMETEYGSKQLDG
ncbi:hypothetical protein HBO10_29600 [Pseudomonas sp. WS 5503]|uniref:hypothetical protein n=1 Tax=Pseudomonas TaxID=286 RepID=UPI0014744362|nr:MULTISPECIES: hypothetical protein [Pseudomonas]MBF6043419.1 hypothetical protein [Pseudomonas mucoides]NMX83663.1 hypothetical protein [Pseudomonas sp. WS 5503]NNB23629.1 hypothetical protein [Pseudomonas fragi]